MVALSIWGNDATRDGDAAAPFDAERPSEASVASVVGRRSRGDRWALTAMDTSAKSGRRSRWVVSDPPMHRPHAYMVNGAVERSRMAKAFHWAPTAFERGSVPRGAPEQLLARIRRKFS